MSRLWDKGDELNKMVQQFTVGEDPELDKKLVRWDTLGSAAHAQMLSDIGILSKTENRSLASALRDIRDLSDRGEFDISPELEDCHTAIEAYLVEKLGDVGQKIHTGRSRNDQVLVAMRLYLRENAIALLESLVACAQVFIERAKKHGRIPMPGYTHLQPAMPSSIGLWLGAFVEAFIELVEEGLSHLDRLNTNPLGAASGFGVPLELDRKKTAKLLGFSRVQRNVIDVQNSRGRYEMKMLRWCTDVGSAVEKFACDAQLYNMKEFGFLSLPVELTTGSSIMPQKRNPDVLELLRGRVAVLRAAEQELAWVTAKLPSNYHRDFQGTKAPVFRAVECTLEILAMLGEVVGSMQIHKEQLEEAIASDLLATYAVYRKVRDGVPFREAYRAVSQQVQEGESFDSALKDDFQLIAKSAEKELSEAEEDLQKLKKQIKQWKTELVDVERTLLG